MIMAFLPAGHGGPDLLGETEQILSRLICAKKDGRRGLLFPRRPKFETSTARTHGPENLKLLFTLTCEAAKIASFRG
jgi:hypothetical protein